MDFKSLQPQSSPKRTEETEASWRKPQGTQGSCKGHKDPSNVLTEKTYFKNIMARMSEILFVPTFAVMPSISFRIKNSACSKWFISMLKYYMHTDHAYYSISLDILILWWPHKGHNRTTYIIKNWTSCQSIQLFIKSGLSWVIESSALQPCKPLFI